jgi:2-dehydro-3-deoxyphosphooctonate aldolase (KDO 8-P synthase)
MNSFVKAGNIPIGESQPLVLISGPCVIEDYETTFKTASFIKKITHKLDIPFIFKASYDKANRTSINSFRGPGIKEGLKILAQIKKELSIQILSDVHSINEVEAAAQVIDIIQIPAFLCRQTDLILEVAKTQKTVNIKKGQFLSPGDIVNTVEKVTSTGNNSILITERGTCFGYNNLVVDFRSIKIIQDATGCPVIFDATHSVQLPGGDGTRSGGDRKFIPLLSKAAVAAGVSGIFLEVHQNPDKALCDGPNSLKLDNLFELLSTLKEIKDAVSCKGNSA